jgi:hypothetical protein
MSNINMGMNIGIVGMNMNMNMDMSMTFHTKQTNLSRYTQTITRPAMTTTSSSRLSFQSPMIDRVVKAKSGCSACGR